MLEGIKERFGFWRALSGSCCFPVVLGGDGEGGDGAAEEGERPAAVVSCSICLDAVITGGEERSTAKLQCGHEFHLGECLVASSLWKYLTWS
jgi:hypothetical protein